MSKYGWAACPADMRTQIENLLDALRKTLGDNLAGMYLHGSLALGCFNPERSDVDVLVVTEKAMTVETKRRIVGPLLHHSANPAPIEISFLTRGRIDPWQYPTPYDFHYSEDRREKVEREIAGSEWKKWNEECQTDNDLAAHITVTRARGIVLCGKPIDQVFPAVPEEDYIDSIVDDFHWARERMLQCPTYFILNACRVLAYLSEKQVLSKDEAGGWALHAVPVEFSETITRALEVYGENRKDERPAKTAMKEFAGYMAAKMSRLLI